MNKNYLQNFLSKGVGFNRRGFAKMAALLRIIPNHIRPGLVTRLVSTTSCLRAEYDIESEEHFKNKVLNSSKPVVVDFHAIWCAPCKSLAPILSKVVASRGDKVDLAKVNIDSHQELAIQYGVAAVPTVILMRDGKMTGSFLGLLSEQEIQEFVPKE